MGAKRADIYSMLEPRAETLVQAKMDAELARRLRAALKKRRIKVREFLTAAAEAYLREAKNQ